MDAKMYPIKISNKLRENKFFILVHQPLFEYPSAGLDSAPQFNFCVPPPPPQAVMAAFLWRRSRARW